VCGDVAVRVQVKRLLDLLRRDDVADDSCSLHLDVVDDADVHAAGAPRSSSVDQPQSLRTHFSPSSLSPAEQPSGGPDRHVTSGDCNQTPPKDLSSVVEREYSALCGRCRTFRLPDVEVRPTPLERVGRRPSVGPLAVVSTPDVVSVEPHYTVV